MRSKARSLIVAACSHSSFGLLCPESAADELGNAIEEAQALAAEFNRSARLEIGEITAPATARRSGVGKARVALARKLAMILHSMWRSGEPFRWSERPVAT